MSEELRKALIHITTAGFQISKDAFDLLSGLSKEDLPTFVIKAINRASLVPDEITIIDAAFLRQLKAEEAIARPEAMITSKTMAPPPASEYDADVVVKSDPSQSLSSTGNMSGYVEYFRDRFRRTEQMFRRRMDSSNAVPIGDALKRPLKTKCSIVGMVTSKRSSSGKLFLEIEAPDGSITALVSDAELMRDAQRVMLDQVVFVDVVKYSDELWIADRLLFPDIPERQPNTSPVDLCCALVSDLHVGSKLFNESLFDRLMKWLRLETGNRAERGLAARVKYLIVAGDLVDGIGIYPEQESELSLTDVDIQYEVASQLLARIPEYVQVIIIPGNHDAVRKCLPQPGIPAHYLQSVSQTRPPLLVGDPSLVALHGVDFLLSHGKSLDDVLTQLPGIGFKDTAEGMEHLLRARHLAPIYGMSTPIAPESRDWMVIDSPPDVMAMGHTHVYDFRKYKDTLIINPGTWQQQTAYQRRMNLTPVPGMCPVVDLQRLKVAPTDLKTLSG